MGGLEVDLNSSVVGTDGKAITGRYAAGELAGDTQGNNRLGGNSALPIGKGSFFCVIMMGIGHERVPSLLSGWLHGCRLYSHRRFRGQQLVSMFLWLSGV